jgi:hypothetical protein
MNRKFAIVSSLTCLLVGVTSLGNGLANLFKTFTHCFTTTELIIGLVLTGIGVGSWAAGIAFIRSSPPPRLR